MHNTGFDTTCTCVFRYVVILSRVFVIFNVDFKGERRATIRQPQIIKFTTFNTCVYAWDVAQKIWIPLAEGMQHCTFSKDQENHKIRQRSIILLAVDDESEDDGSYDLSVEDAPCTVPMDPFQVETRAAFEHLCFIQNIYEPSWRT